jgi:hypothetical protein
MARLLYSIEDYLEDVAQASGYPRWIRHFVHALSRTAGETGDLIAFR